jgi:predicted HAD superfamily Cof-like phosphohydrolase
MDSNFQRVKTWMQEVGQPTPTHPCRWSPELLQLRRTLINEECDEVLAVFEYMEVKTPNLVSTDITLEMVKELCDLLVVTYGALVSLGVDGDAAFRLVMENNDGKIAHAQRREDGKTVVPAEIKVQLKEKMRRNLLNLLNLEAA